MRKLFTVFSLCAALAGVSSATMSASGAPQSSSQSKSTQKPDYSKSSRKMLTVPSSPGTQPCPIRTGKNNHICVLPINWLALQIEHNHEPIEVFHKDEIIWVGDDGELLVVNPLTRCDCKNEHQPVTPDSDEDVDPTDAVSNRPVNANSGMVTENKKNETHCYKHNIDIYDAIGQNIVDTVDPHIIIDPGNPIEKYPRPYNLLLGKKYKRHHHPSAKSTPPKS